MYITGNTNRTWEKYYSHQELVFDALCNGFAAAPDRYCFLFLTPFSSSISILWGWRGFVLLAGDVIAADGILTKSSDLRVDESSHTGESDDVYKSTDTDPALYCGQ